MDNDKIELATVTPEVLPPDSLDRTEKLISSAASVIHPVIAAFRVLDKVISSWHSNTQAEISLRREESRSKGELALRNAENTRLEIQRSVNHQKNELAQRSEEIRIAGKNTITQLKCQDKENKRSYKKYMKRLDATSRENMSCMDKADKCIDAAVNAQGENVRGFLEEARYYTNLRK